MHKVIMDLFIEIGAIHLCEEGVLLCISIGDDPLKQCADHHH